MTIQEALNIALNHHRSGKIDQAENIYQQVIAADPNQPDALRLMGIVCCQKNNRVKAVELFQHALKVLPDQPDVLNNLAITLKELGQNEQAIETYKHLLKLYPQNPADIQNNLGNLYRLVGQPENAVESYNAAATLLPDNPAVHYNLGVVLQDLFRFEQAIVAYQKALALNPNLAIAHNNLGNAYKAVEQNEKALECFRRAIAIDPNHAMAHANLAALLVLMGNIDQAVESCMQAIRIQPQNADFHSALGDIYLDCAMFADAIPHFQNALNLNPNLPVIHNKLGYCLYMIGKFNQAVERMKQSIALKPDYSEAYNNLAYVMINQGVAENAIQYFRKSLELAPNCAAYHSNLIFLMHYLPGCSQADIFNELVQWNKSFGKTDPNSALSLRADPSPDRKLRIGFVSADFLNHPVSRFIIPLFQNLDPDRFEIHAYSNNKIFDSVSAKIQSLAHHWTPIYLMNDDRFEKQVREDRIDILIDLAIHSSGNRLKAFSRRLAPLQICWLAYCGSSGLHTMDYRLSDPQIDPHGLFDPYYTEKTLLLPDCHWCCNVPADAPTPHLPPDEHPVFGCFNTFRKINPLVLKLWAAILAKTPGATLLLHAQEGDHRDIICNQFQHLGVDPNRIRFFNHGSAVKYFALYNQIHVALDPFPYNGGTTTCDALYMGVPVVSRIWNDRAAGRAGLSLLSQVGLSDLAVDSDDAYIQTAVDLAQNAPRLRELRANLRNTMLASPLMDAPRFAKNFGDLLKNL